METTATNQKKGLREVYERNKMKQENKYHKILANVLKRGRNS